MSNVLEAISKLKLKNSKNHFSILVLLPAQFGVAVTRWSRSTQLLYVEPG